MAGTQRNMAGLPRLDEVETQPLVEIDTSIPHTARMYDYLLGGKDNFAADRAAAQTVLAAMPELPLTLRLNRQFLRSAVRWTARRGIRQYLDIGTGIPTAGNTHETAQSVAPDARVAYVDNDPIVLAHARALMAGHGLGRTTFTQADLREPEKILAAPGVREVIDLEQPVALLLISILHFIRDEERPFEIVSRLVDALPSGSFLLLTHASPDADPERAAKASQGWRTASAQMTMRPHGEVLRFFDGLEVVEPGLVCRWNPDGDDEDEVLELGDRVMGYGAVARKP
ncbi:SAM-dependent methyltransferase [Peterkaempfera sp. SMS 1(5)a]|uniref:SAM-dependent methyltransferase n=1 Tax=Peterkaempfera podocarpi TaxID=3232308 RepID=UPI00366E391F